VQATKEALMRIEIRGRKMAVTDELRKRVEKRFAKIARQVPELAQLEVELYEDPKRRVADTQVAEATLHLKGKTLRARESAGTMITAINSVSEDMARQVKRTREKRRGRRESVPPNPTDATAAI
jgi:putative sigma-54 modulation protein